MSFAVAPSGHPHCSSHLFFASRNPVQIYAARYDRSIGIPPVPDQRIRSRRHTVDGQILNLGPANVINRSADGVSGGVVEEPEHAIVLRWIIRNNDARVR